MGDSWLDPIHRERTPEEIEEIVKKEWERELQRRPIVEVLQMLPPFTKKDHMEAIISDALEECDPQKWDRKWYDSLDWEEIRWEER